MTKKEPMKFKKAKVAFILVIVVLMGYLALNSKSTSMIYTHEATSTPSGVDEVMSRKDFQEKMRLQAEYELLVEQKGSEQKRHDEEMTRIEKGLETLRGKQVNFQ